MLALCFALFALLHQPQPSIKISVGTPRRIVTDTGNGGYQAFPDLCRLKDGTLFCIFYAGYTHISAPNAEHPKGGAIGVITSKDEGKTWSEPRIMFDSPEDDRDPSICCLPDGTLLCNYFNYGKNQEIEVCLIRSTDNGETWSEPEVVLPSFATSTPIRRLRSGRLVMPVYTVDGNGKRAYSAVILSDDKGKTWSSPHPIGLKAGRIIDETDIYERKDGTLLAVCREVMVGSESKDGGKHWSDVYPLGFVGIVPICL